jgi:hypothetical protein
MRIQFEDKSYIEVLKGQDGKVIITIVAREDKDSLSVIANSVQLTIEQFDQLVKS